jgi:hypothetical protein
MKARDLYIFYSDNEVTRDIAYVLHAVVNFV